MKAGDSFKFAGSGDVRGILIKNVAVGMFVYSYRWFGKLPTSILSAGEHSPQTTILHAFGIPPNDTPLNIEFEYYW
jgi:hypothetical protein